MTVPPLAAQVQLDQLRLYVDTHRNDAYLESVIVLLVAMVMLTWLPWQIPAVWSGTYLPVLLLAHRSYARFLAIVPPPDAAARWFTRIAAVRLVLTLMWASIPFWGWQEGDLFNNGLIVVLLIGSLGSSAALSTARWSLYLIDTVPVAAALVSVPSLGREGFGPTYSLLCIAFVSYLMLPAIVTNRNTTRLIRLQHEKDGLIADLAAARDAAERANQAKTGFLASISHELRTPLNGMLGAAQLLRSRPLGPDEATLVRVLHEAGRGLLSLVNDLLDLANVEGGRVRIVQRPFAPRVLLDTVAGILRPTANAKGLTLSASVGTGLPERLTGDEARVRQVLLNLAGNAVKFTDQGGVALRLDWRDGILTAEVRDSGIGIAPARRRQLDEGGIGPDPARGGAGLGLSISRGLLAAMGGTLHLDSVPGRGTTVVARLPAAEPPAAPTPAVVAPAAVVSGNPRLSLTVLVVEDVYVNRFILEKMLDHLGHGCVLAETGEDGLARLGQRPVDLVMTDIRLPGIDGLEMTRRLRALDDPRLANLPVVAMTANLFPDDIASYRAAGVTEILPKPIDLQALSALLGRMEQAADQPRRPLPGSVPRGSGAEPVTHSAADSPAPTS